MQTTNEPADGNVTPLRGSRPRPKVNALLAAAQRITGKLGGRPGQKATTAPWQDDAWDVYDVLGEVRFLANTLGGRAAQARWYVGILPDDPTEDPEPEESGPAVDAWAQSFGANPVALGQMVARAFINLFVPGDGWLVGIPKWLMPEAEEQPGITPQGRPEETDEVDLKDLVWRMLSISEVQRAEEEVTLRLDENVTVKAKASQVFLIRVWRSHPRRWWEADSPVRSTLPVLREIVGLSMDTSSQIDSRLAGAGVFIVPQSARDAIVAAMDLPEDGDDSDPFTEALMEAMLTPISDRSNASARVPLVMVVPDGTTEQFKHLTFSTTLDDKGTVMMDAALRRASIGLDAPPELLLGVGGMNHWGAWLVKEDTVTTHLTPPLAIIADAFTTQFLHPLLLQQGMAEEDVAKRVVWFDVKHLILNPNMAQDAFALHKVGAITDDSLRDATGFGDSDAPEKIDAALAVVMELVQGAPSLAGDPGMPALVAQVRSILGGDTPPEAPELPEDEGGEPEMQGPPDTMPPGMAAALADPPASWGLRAPGEPALFERAALTAGTQAPTVNVTLDPNLDIALSMPDGAVQVNVPEQRPADVVVNVPQVAPPAVYVDPTPVTVRSPDVHVTSPEVTVNVPETPVTVQSPDVVVNVPETQVTVEAPQVTVEAPQVHIDTPPVEVTVPPAEVTVNVPAAEVNVTVPEPKKRRTHTDITRDAQGRITGVDGEDWA